MCNDYEQHVSWKAYQEMLWKLELGIPTQQTESDLPQADDIRINDVGPVMRAAGNVIELAPMTFGFPPGRPKGSPVFNFRSEGRSFAKSLRCLIPASAFFEFTVTKYPKAKHRFTLNGAPFMAIAGIWADVEPAKPPGPQMRPQAQGARKPIGAEVSGRRLSADCSLAGQNRAQGKKTKKLPWRVTARRGSRR